MKVLTETRDFFDIGSACAVSNGVTKSCAGGGSRLRGEEGGRTGR